MTARARVTSVEALSGELRSPLAGVSNAAWNRFVNALIIDDDSGPHKGRPRPFNACAFSGGLGCFATLPKRLVDLGVIKETAVLKGKKAIAKKDGRLIAFLANPIAQYKVFVASTLRYGADHTPLLQGMTRSGALALFHRLGPNALGKWQARQEPSTIALYQRANGIF